MIGIYKITNKINNKCYIGQSVDIESRWRHHKAAAFNKNSFHYQKTLYKAFRKYGLENFSFEIIELCSANELNLKEKYWIQFYNSYENGYNSTKGSREEEYKNKQHKESSFLSKEQVEQIKNILKTNFNLSTDDIGKLFNVSGRTIRDINNGKTWSNEQEEYPIRKPYASLTLNYEKLGEKTYCIDCGIEIAKGSIRCVKCNHKLQYKTQHPTRQQLKELIRKFPFTQIASKYGVSDNAIRKWCDAEGLPRKKREIDSYSDEEWEKI